MKSPFTPDIATNKSRKSETAISSAHFSLQVWKQNKVMTSPGFTRILRCTETLINASVDKDAEFALHAKGFLIVRASI